jgi:signal transduction histidine kinase/ActR/RegA family two-component response regulator
MKNLLKQPNSVVVRYLLPFLAIIVTLGVQWVLQEILGKRVDFPYALLYLIAVFAVAWVGGYVPGAIASLLVIVGLPAATAHSFRLANLDLSRIGLMLAVSLAISAVADALRKQREALRRSNDELDQRVQARTADLDRVVQDLKAEVVLHEKTEQRLQTQLERLGLLDQITRAIGERQDPRSVFQAVVRRLEDSLGIDFGCVCVYDAARESLTVECVGIRSEALAMEMALTDQANVTIDQNGLSRCVMGHLVYEPDVSEVKSPFPQRLSQGGLRSLVAAPLLVESQIFGVLIASRKQPDSFSSSDCEFLRQLSEHAALAAHQAQVYSALRQAYDDLRQSQQTVMQQERLRALGQMASGIAHDINNAISPVALYTELLLEREPNLSTRTREYLQTTQRAIEDVAHTVARMREFYRKRETQLILTPVTLNQLVQQVVDLTRARWHDMPEQRGIVIQMKLDLAQDLPEIAGIESEIREALTNLIFNAVDAMPDGGVLTVRTKTVRNQSNAWQAVVEVADTGIGMDEETRKRCLEPFFTTKGERGTGLGLGMVYGVSQRHGAEIEIDSNPGRGTTVRLSFPVSAKSETALSVVPAAEALPPRLRILVVDDDPLLIKSLRDTLEADGHVVTTANGGQEGIDAFRAAENSGESFSVVITDLGMPYVDGRKVASAVKTMSSSTPVILLTGWGQRLVAEGDVPPHVDSVLNKPPKLRDLRVALNEVVAGQQSVLV